MADQERSRLAGTGVTGPLSPTLAPVPPAPARHRRRRRPSGEPPPLPRDLRRSGRVWAGLFVGVFVFWMVVALTGARAGLERVDQAVLDLLVRLRSDPVTAVMRRLQVLGSEGTVTMAARLGLLAALVFRRFRHALVFLGCIVFVTWVASTMALMTTRPRPFGVPILGVWHGYSHPSRPVAYAALCAGGLIFMLVPHGRPRTVAKWVAGSLLLALAVARLYLAVDHLSDVVVAIIVGVAVPIVAFRWLVPNEVFPVTYRKGRAAHLDVSGRRGEAIRRALKEQLGLEVLDLQPFGLEGSSGSTPLRLRVAGDGPTWLFGKLYAATHLRADRWYKLGRTLLYGRLEDESTFSTVRRLVQYEDYLLRIMHGAGLPTPTPYGFVEITPEREYLIVSEFFEGAREIGSVEIGPEVVDHALAVVRGLWEAGLAHRDIKPANVLVRGDEILLIDVAFAEVRPSPWRQAVDLANMMLVLALSSSPEMVYERALRVFSADELAEAFAAARGITLPSQLRARLRRDGRDLLARFRAMAPPRPPVRVSRWSLRRVGLTVAVVVVTLLTVNLGFRTLLNLTLL